MQFFDLHCDTLYKAVTEQTSLNEPTYEVSIDRGKSFNKWRECTAIWIPDGITDKDATELFTLAYIKLCHDSNAHGINICKNGNGTADHEMLFTVENGAVLGNDLSKVDLLSDCGVRMLTLTWNAENHIGGGADAQSVGLTDFGKACIKRLEESSIVIDMSHASDKLFYDVFEHTEKPIAASHSNSRAVCNHRRNLTDDQFKLISQRGGVVGLNFHRDFLSENPQNASLKDVLDHAEHFLSLGGEDSLCIGSDFDGSDIPKDLSCIEKIPNLYEAFLKIGYTEQLVQKIMYDNAHNFFSRF